MDDAVQARAYAEADFSEAHQDYVDRFRQYFPRFLPRRVIDLGCGPGDVTLRFWRAWPHCSILAVDGAGAMLTLARQAVETAGAADHIQLRQMVLPDEDLPAAAFDTVLSNSLLHHLADPSVLWDTVKHCAGSGARIWIMDLLRPRDETQLEALVSHYASDAPAVLRKDFRCSLLAAYTVDEVQVQLQQAGLSTLSVRAVSDRHLQVCGQLPDHSGAWFVNDFRHPDEAWLRDWFRDMKHIAVVGLSPKANRPSHIVAKKMQAFGYHIIPVRLAVASVLGEPAYADLADVPGPVDVVCVFRAPDLIGPIVDVCIARHVPVLWLQEGVVNQREAERAAAAGIRVIMDRCLLKDYLRTLG